MSQQQMTNRQRKMPLPREVTPIYTKPSYHCGGEEQTNSAVACGIEIHLPYDMGVVETGQGTSWSLSLVPVTAPIAGFTIFDGAATEEDFNETNLNCLTFTGPKRIELVATDNLSDKAFLVFQEVIENSVVTGWQIYSPIDFNIIADPETETDIEKPTTWQTALTTDVTTIKQVRLYEDCDFAITATPPPIPGALFQKVTSSEISEFTVWR